MARRPAPDPQRVRVATVLLALAGGLVAFGVAAVALGALRPELLPAAVRPTGVPVETIGGAAVALGSGAVVVGACQAVLARAIRRRSAGAAALTAAGSATAAMVLVGAAVALVVSGLPVVALVPGAAAAVYAWAAVVLARVLHRCGA